MHKNHVLILLLLLSLFTSTNAQNGVYYKGLNGCIDGKDENCTYVSIKLDQIRSGKSAKALNRAIEDTVLSTLSWFGESKFSTIDEGMTNFINSYVQDVKDGGMDFPWFLDITGTIEYFNPQIISYSLSHGVYTGGAHPNSFTAFYNFDPNTGKAFTLTDLFGKYNTEKLDRLLDKIYRKENDIPVKADLQKHGLFVEKITANNNFAVTKDGMIFYYNQYEIAPYSAGPIEIQVTYKELKDIIKNNSLLNKMIN
jgi:hypothetical protein